MNPRIAKEMKVLRPAFLLTLAAAAMPLVIGPNRHELPEIWMGIIFAMGCLIMGAEAFGNEFQQKTLALLLTQPLPRTFIWKEKMQVLGAALAIGTGALAGAVMLFDRQVVSAEGFPWMAWVLIPIAILCTTPYWTLLLRNTLLGALLTFVAPVLLLGMNSYLHYRWLENGKFIFGSWFVVNGFLYQKWIHDPAAEESSVITLLILYCAVCCWLGYRRFRSLQVVDAQGTAAFRELGLPARLETLLLRPFKAMAAGFIGPLASLVKKELRLQQITFVGAALFCLMAVAGAVLFHLTSDESLGRNWAMGILFADYHLYLPILPLIAGTVAVAEEKAWGVADWQLTLPPSALKQWTAKVVVALTTSLVLGLLLPVALLLAGTMLFGGDQDLHFHNLRSPLCVILDQNSFWMAPVSVALAFLFCVVLAQMLLTSVAVYAASIASSTARALVLALAMLIAAACLLEFFAAEHPYLALQIAQFLRQMVPSQMANVALLTVSIFIPLCLIHCLAYRCYRSRELTRNLLRFQVPLMVLALCFLAIVFATLIAFVRIADEHGTADRHRPVAGQRAF